MRGLLVPILVEMGYHPAFIQPRKRSFVDHMIQKKNQNQKDGETSGSGFYEVDTIEFPITEDSSSSSSYGKKNPIVTTTTTTDHIPCWGAFSLGRDENEKHEFVEALQKMEQGYVRAGRVPFFVFVV